MRERRRRPEIREEEQPNREEGHAGEGWNPGSDPIGQRPSERRDEHHHQRLRGEQQAGARRTQTAPLDEIERDQEEDAVHADVIDHRAGGRAGECGSREERQIQHRPRDAPLDAQEHGEQHDRGADEPQRGRRRPAPGVPLVEPQEQREQTREEGGRPRPVEPFLDPLGRVGDDVPGAQEQRRRSDRHVDVEDGAPAPVLRQKTAQRRTYREPEVGHRRLQPQRLATLAGREGLGEDGGRIREQHGCADRLDGAEGDQPLRRGRETAQRGAGDESGEAPQIDALVPAHVAQPPESQQQAAHHQEVDGHHPFDGRDVGAQLVAQDRQDGVHHAAVEGGHEGARSDGDEHPPLAWIRRSRGRRLLVDAHGAAFVPGCPVRATVGRAMAVSER